jgi:hypothetical protein
MAQITAIPYVKISPSKLVCYNVLDGIYRKSSFYDNFKYNDPNGWISSAAAKRIRTALEWLIYFSPSRMVMFEDCKKRYPFKLSFLTLTLPSKQVHSDKEIKERCINQFNIEIRKKFKVSLYLWKAESQKNGNIHFHYTLNKYIYWKKVQLIWNRIINKLGYVDRYNQEWSGLTLDEYIDKRGIVKKEDKKKAEISWKYGEAENWMSPNSVDVHSVKKIKDLDAYLVKYFLKNDESRRPVDGKLWQISEPLQKFKGAASIVSGLLSDELNKISVVFKSLFRQFNWSCIYKCSVSDIAGYFKKSKILEIFYNYIDSIKLQYNLNFG